MLRSRRCFAVVSALLLVMAVLAHGVAGTPTAVAATPVVKVYPTSGTVGFPVKVAFWGSSALSGPRRPSFLA